jgi:hypothetical protein
MSYPVDRGLVDAVGRSDSDARLAPRQPTANGHDVGLPQHGTASP